MAHNYGLADYVRQNTPYEGEPIRVERPYKKVILVNVGDCKDRITVSNVCYCLQGTGWFEWEDLLSHWLVQAVVDAIHDDKDEADISKLFTCELQGEDKFGMFRKTQERVIEFLMENLFEWVYEDSDVMRVRIIEKAICPKQA